MLNTILQRCYLLWKCQIKKNGILVSNQEELEESINLLINDEKLREKYSEEIYKTISNKFIWKNTVKKIESDINERIK